MTEFINIQIEKCNANKSIFVNKNLFENLYLGENSKVILDYYKKDFMKVIECIDKILENLVINIHLVPYSLKCFCKIISILINKKFPNILKTEKNAFIAKFFFNIIFSPIFKNPSIEALINDFIISRNSLYNFNIISDIINQLTSGNLFTNNYYTPFNWYFIDKMPIIYNLLDQITNVSLNPFIEKLINDELDENFNYNYFEENEDEVMLHRSICFKLENIDSLLENMNKNKDKLFSNEDDEMRRTVLKLRSKRLKEMFDKLLNHEEYEIIGEIQNEKSKKKNETNGKKRKKLYFFLNTKLIWNDNYKKLFSIKKTTNFQIEELKKIENEEDVLKNNVIKVKNYFSM